MVTGGCGYIGSHQVAHLLEAGHDVVVVDDLSNAKPTVLDRIEAISGRRPELFELNVLDTDELRAVIRQTEPDAVIHLAGYKHVPESTERVLDYYENNVGGLLSLLRACEPTETRRLVFSSSGSVYGETDRLPITEGHPHNPTNPYSSTKSICERILRDLCTGDDTWAVAALRYFNPAGAHPSGMIGEDPRGPTSNLLPAVMNAATDTTTKTGRTVNIYGDDFATADGSGVRDYVHVMDVAETHSRALEHLTSNPGFLALNVGRGSGSSALEVVSAMERASAQPLAVKIHPRRPGDVSALYSDTDKSRSIFGPIDYRDLDEICDDAWRWHRGQVQRAEREHRNSTQTTAPARTFTPAGAPSGTPTETNKIESDTRSVALVHEWLDARSGSEILFEQLAQEFPAADLFALTGTREPLFDFGGRTVQTTFLDRFPGGHRTRALQLPLMPTAWQQLDRTNYDLVITSTHAFGREFATQDDLVHCNYVHSPMRYAWTPELDGRADRFGRAANALRSLAKTKDKASAAGVTSFAANSAEVAQRITDFYDRKAKVIYPPVQVDYFSAISKWHGNYLLAASRWIPYKRLDIAIEVAAALDLPLILAGWGDQEELLRHKAQELHPNGVDIRVRPSQREMRKLMAGADAFIFPAHEDFGIIAVEAQATGTPVVGLKAGGSLDTVIDGVTGTLADAQTAEAFTEATERCLRLNLEPEPCRTHARSFSTARFRQEIRDWTDGARSQ